MKRFLIPLTAIISLSVIAATVAPNVPISQFPIAPVLFTNAWIPIIQPLPGRTTNDNFRVAPSAFAAFLGTNNTSGSNVYNTIITTNLTVVTNLYITTNTYIVNVTTNLAGLWTDTLGDYTPTQADQSALHATNIHSLLSLSSDGAFLMPFAFIDQVLPGTNDLSPYQLGTMRIQSDVNTTNPVDRIVRLNAGSGNGQVLFIENYTSGGITNSAFSMINGSTNWDGSGTLTLCNGDWKPTHSGETIWLQNDGIGWREITRFFGAAGGQGVELWTNNAGILEPVNLALPVEIDSQLRFGPGATNVLSRYGDRSLLYTNSATAAQGSVNIEVKNGNGVDTAITANDGLGTLQTTAAQLGLLANSVQVNVGQGQNSFFPSTSTTKLGFSGQEWNSLYLTNQIVFGPGSTNNLLRDDVYLVYSQSGAASGVIARNGSSGQTSLIAENSQGTGQIVTSYPILSLANNGYHIELNGSQLLPSAFINIGSQLQQFGDYWSRGTNYINGYYSLASTNYSRLALHHTGTNGVGDGIVFDSQASGAGGTPRPIQLQSNGTNYLQLSANTLSEAVLFANTAGLELVSTNGYGIGFSPNGSFAWQFDLNGHLMPNSSNTRNIGVDGAGTVSSAALIAANVFIFGTQHTPANSSETNYAGAMTYDANNLYIWTATNVNKKVPLTSW